MNVAEGIYIEKSGNRMERSYQKIQKACPEKYQQRFKDDRIGTQKKKKS